MTQPLPSGSLKKANAFQSPPGPAWSLQNPVVYTLVWIAVIVAVFAPLAVRRYLRGETRR